MIKERSRFSLKTLFLLMTGVAAMTAMIGNALHQPSDMDRDFAMASIIGGGFFGMCLGLRFPRKLVGAVVGWLSGSITASLSAALLTSRPTLPAAFASCAAVLIVSIVLRER